MGWTVTSKPPHISPADYIADHTGCFKYANCGLDPEHRPRIVARTARGSTLYFAVLLPEIFLELRDRAAKTYVRALDGSVVTCVVVETQNYRDGEGCNFGYKDMGEDAGPYCNSPGPEFLARLSPLDPAALANPDSAASRIAVWREACALQDAKAASRRASVKALSHHATILLPEPVQFSDGRSETRFAPVVVPVVRRGKTRHTQMFKRACDGAICKLPANLLQTARAASAGTGLFAARPRAKDRTHDNRR